MGENKTVTMAMWETAGSITDIAQPGDYMEDDIVMSFLNCVPPATHRRDLIQCGEPYGSAWDEVKGTYRTTYMTFSLSHSGWRYNGACFLGETTHRIA